MPASFFISLSKEDFKGGDRTKRTKYYLGKVKVKNSSEFVLHDRGINPNRLVDPNGDYDEEDEEEGKEAMSREEKEASDLLDALIKPRVELSCVLYSDDKNSDTMMNVGVPKVFGTQVAVWQGTSREDKLLHNLKAVVDRGSRNTLMRDQLMVLSDYEDPTRDVNGIDYNNRRVLASEKNFNVEYMEGGDPGKVIRKSVARGDNISFPSIQMHRVEKEEWAVQFTAPFTMLQVFGICLTRFALG